MSANDALAGTVHFLLTPWRALRWAMLTRPIRFTRFGTFYVLFSLAVGGSAINTGNNLLYLILGLLLGLIVVSGVLSDSGLWGLTSELHLQGAAFAREKAVFELTLEKTRFPSVMTWITALWSDGNETTVLAPWVPSHGRARLTITATPSKRGRLALPYIRYGSRFPFGLFEKFHRETRDESWVVYPARARVDETILQTLQQGQQAVTTRRTGEGELPYLFRDYREGDSLRRIQWKLSAKRGHWTVQDMEAEASASDWLAVSHWPEASVGDEREEFISFVASLVDVLLAKGRRVGLATPDACFAPEIGNTQRHRLLRYLALVEMDNIPATRPLWAPEARRATDVAALWVKGQHAAA